MKYTPSKISFFSHCQKAFQYENILGILPKRLEEKEKKMSRGRSIHNTIDQLNAKIDIMSEFTPNIFSLLEKIPNDLCDFEPILTILAQNHGLSEIRMALKISKKDFSFKKASFSEPEDENFYFLRGILDFMYINENTFFIYDWKTGKGVNTDIFPIQLYGLMVSEIYGNITKKIRLFHFFTDKKRDERSVIKINEETKEEIKIKKAVKKVEIDFSYESVKEELRKRIEEIEKSVKEEKFKYAIDDSSKSWACRYCDYAHCCDRKNLCISSSWDETNLEGFNLLGEFGL